MSDIKQRIEELESVLDAQLARTRKGLTFTCVANALVIVFVAAYTLFIVPGIKELTTPGALGETANAFLATELPAQRRAFVALFRANSKTWAGELIEVLQGGIPLLENHLEGILDEYAGAVGDALEAKLSPAFRQAITENSPKLRTEYARARKDVGNSDPADAVLALIQVQMSEYLGDDFVREIGKLQQRLDALTTEPIKDLTRKEEAQRRALTSWAVLAERGEVGEAVALPLLEQVRERLAEVLTLE